MKHGERLSGRAPALGSDDDYPRPQLVRPTWMNLEGIWEFAYDDDDCGLIEGWFQATREPDGAFSSSIRVPFPPESTASGIGDPSYHPVVWYRRSLNASELLREGHLQILHFGAVDYRAQVWLSGEYVGSHEGGFTPFSFDVSAILMRNNGSATLVVRAEDDPLDVGQPRGKQDWRQRPHGIWYQRTTGIWQPVWLESVPSTYVKSLSWTPQVQGGTVRLEVELNRRPTPSTTLRVRLRYDNEQLADVSVVQTAPRASIVITLPRQSNGQEYESLLWSPDNPRLVEAEIEVETPGEPTDVIGSYFGLRSVGWTDGRFLLNDRPFYVRAVLSQGYWPNSHMAAPTAAALRDEVRLIKDLGFNAARVHQKAEDPRFLYWADRLGVLIWSEMPSTYEFSHSAIERLSREWLDVIRRDMSHPSIAVWLPINESWGIQHVSQFPDQLHYVRALYHLTKAVDPTRPVVSNDGWEHAESDIWTVHDYSGTGKELAANYADRTRVEQLINGFGPLGRRIRLLRTPDRGEPVIVSEFGGISFATGTEADSWGYTRVDSAASFESSLRMLFSAIQSSPVLAGFCYTQLTDTAQETNGLADSERKPKLPAESISLIVRGEPHRQLA